MLKQLVKAITCGSRATGDLRPVIADDLPEGVNLNVLEYDEIEGTCIVEISGYDHASLPVNKRVTKAVFDKVVAGPGVLSKLASHPKRPAKLHELSMSKRLFDQKNKGKPAGEKLKSLRTETRRCRDGVERDFAILDEG